MLLVKKISDRTGIPFQIVQRVTTLLEDGATIPFIARYRKEQTNSLDEVSISKIQSELKQLLALIKRKEGILNTIESQGFLNDKLKNQIEECWDEKKLEDLYLPYKKKVKTKATIAIDNGLEGLAKIIMSQKSNNLGLQAQKFTNKNVPTVELAFEGAKHIIANWINENSNVRDIIRGLFQRKAILTSKIAKGKEKDGEKFRDYFDYKALISKTPSHRLLAILRGETENFLKVKIDIDFDEAFERLNRYFIRTESESKIHITEAIADALKRLIFPSIRNEILKDYKEKADFEAINIFARNAKELLLSPPLGAKRIMGIDPGYRSGCKLVCLDEYGSLISNTNIYPHPPQKQTEEAETVVLRSLTQFSIEAIAVGNGTAGRETYNWLKKIIKETGIEIFLVNEDGASIYSASEIAREEFPDYDITVRGAVSIARRLMDPLAELVKIDPKSIGVGQYQHDVNQLKLKESLTETVISCVNKVGVNVNTASKHLLTYISGLGPTLAQNIVDYRSEKGKIKSIKELNKVPRLGSKAFEQCAGFLRVKDGKNPLDNTGVHPESYHIVQKMILDLNQNLENIVKNEMLLDKIDLTQYVNDKIGLPSLIDIISELKKPGLDPRSQAKAIVFEESLESISDLTIGQVLNGVITNLTKFGAFVDLGIKESALLHISQITDRFISDPAEILSLNQEVRVKVIDLDIERKRISITMKGVA